MGKNKTDILLARARSHLCVEWVSVGAGDACARVALITRHATCRHIVICGLSVSTIFFDIISQMA
jgi:hypothetical protein